jgi:hypothetical protein
VSDSLPLFQLFKKYMNDQTNPSSNQTPATENMNQDYQISNDAHFAADDIPF